MPPDRPSINRRLALGVRITVGVIAVALGVGVFATLVSTKPTAPRAARTEAVLPVEAITVQNVLAPRRWPGFGAAEALEAADVAAEVAGVVVERPERIDPGAAVEMGELIVAIESDEFEQRLARAREAVASLEASLESLDVEEQSLRETLALAEEATRLLQWELTELERAAERGAASDQEVNRLRRELTRVRRDEVDLRQRLEQIPPRRAQLTSQIGVEQANARLAEIDLNRSRILSPINGVLQSVSVKEGERVAPGEPIARVVDLHRMEIPLRAPVGAGNRVEVGDRAVVRTDDRSAARWEGEVVRVAPEADPRSRTITIFLEIEQDPRDPSVTLLRPGQFVVGDVFESRSASQRLVPRAAIDRDRVLLVGDDDRVEARQVEVSHYLDGRFPDIDPRETQWAAVAAGVEPGDRVIISNLEDLEPGALVDPSPPGAGSVRAAAPDDRPATLKTQTP